MSAPTALARLQSLGFTHLALAHFNLSPAELVEAALCRGEGTLGLG